VTELNLVVYFVSAVLKTDVNGTAYCLEYVTQM
jgi:hypothetical protein